MNNLIITNLFICSLICKQKKTFYEGLDLVMCTGYNYFMQDKDHFIIHTRINTTLTVE